MTRHADIFLWEGLWLDWLAGFLDIDLADPVLIRETAAAVKTLTQKFVTRSDKGNQPASRCGVYGDLPAARSGYTLYYLLKNLPKIVYILEHTPGDLLRCSEVLDLGTGPGTAILGWLMARHRSSIASDAFVSGIDRSRGFVHQARHLVRTFAETMSQPIRSEFSTGDISRGRIPLAGRYSLVVASNVLGEIPENRLETAVESIVARVKPRGYLLLMAPALHWTARRLLTVRDSLCDSGWTVMGPCPGSYPCPAMALTRDWCHHRLPWAPPQFLVNVDRQAGFKKRLINFTYIVMKNSAQQEVPAPVDSDPGFLVVSDLLKMKGKYEIHVCGRLSRDQSDSEMKWTVVLEKKNLSDTNREILDLKRYDRIKFQNISFKNRRILIKKETGIDCLDPIRGGVV